MNTKVNIFDQDDINNVLDTIQDHLHSEVEHQISEKGLVETIALTVIPTLWTEEQKVEALEQVTEGIEGKYKKVLVDIFRVNETIAITDSHISYIKRVFNKYKHLCDNLTEEIILQHDLSKYSFLELVGYTAKWVWNLDCPLWQEALSHHYKHNPHHPQCYPGQKMPLCHLEESVIDMIACHWERTLNGKEDVTARELINFSDVYLNRYLDEDRQIVRSILQKIGDSEQ